MIGFMKHPITKRVHSQNNNNKNKISVEDMDVYTFLSSIPKTELFNYVVLGIVIVIVTVRIQPAPYILLGLAIACTVSFVLHEKAESSGSKFIVDMEKQLLSTLLRDTKNFFIDSEMVIFVMSHREYYEYNPATYRSMIQKIDKFLKVARDSEQEATGEKYEIAREIKTQVMNTYHSMIHTVPHDSSATEKYQDGLTELEKLLNFHLNNIHTRMSLYYGKRPVTIHTRLIHHNALPGADSTVNSHYSFF